MGRGTDVYGVVLLDHRNSTHCKLLLPPDAKVPSMQADIDTLAHQLVNLVLPMKKSQFVSSTDHAVSRL